MGIYLKEMWFFFSEFFVQLAGFFPFKKSLPFDLFFIKHETPFLAVDVSIRIKLRRQMNGPNVGVRVGEDSLCLVGKR